MLSRLPPRTDLTASRLGLSPLGYVTGSTCSADDPVRLYSRRAPELAMIARHRGLGRCSAPACSREAVVVYVGQGLGMGPRCSSCDRDFCAAPDSPLLFREYMADNGVQRLSPTEVLEPTTLQRQLFGTALSCHGSVLSLGTLLIPLTRASLFCHSPPLSLSS